jgi:hypothetical protein
VESRRQRPVHKRNPSLRDNAGASDSVHADLPHIAALIPMNGIRFTDPYSAVAGNRSHALPYEFESAYQLGLQLARVLRPCAQTM